jgi:hypothetical protein
MLERLMVHGAALARRRIEARRARLVEALEADAPAGVRISAGDEGAVLSGRGLKRRFALDPALRWLAAGLRR